MIENRKMIGFFITSNVEYFLFKFPFFRGWVDCQTIVWTKITYKKSLVTWQIIIIIIIITIIIIIINN